MTTIQLINTIVSEETAKINNQLRICFDGRLLEIGESPENWSLLSLYERKGQKQDADQVLNDRKAAGLKTGTTPPEILKILTEEVEAANVILKIRVDKRCSENGIDPRKVDFQVEHLGVTTLEQE